MKELKPLEATDAAPADVSTKTRLGGVHVVFLFLC